MGAGEMFVCKKCGETFFAMTGIGMLFPTTYEETVKDMKAGKYGEEWKRFLTEHPDGKVNCEKVLLVCEKCGVPKTGTDLSLYLPKKNTKNLNKYPFADELEKHYTLFARYPHTCEKCGGTCKATESTFDLKLTCAECGGEMENSHQVVLWD